MNRTLISGLIMLVMTLAATGAQAIILTDPGFDAAFGGDYTVNSSDAGLGWRAPGAGTWAQAADISGHTAANRTGDYYAAILQVIHDQQTTTGTYTLSFEATNTDTWPVPAPGGNGAGYNRLEVGVYGVNGTSWSFITGNGNVDPGATLLGGVTVLNGTTADSFPWTGFQTAVDFGATGYDYVIVRVAGLLDSGTTSQSPDELLAVDSIALEVPEPATLALIAAGAPLMLVRRRRA